MKSIILIFLSSLFSFASSAQTATELNDSLLYYYNNNQLAQAIPVAKKIVEFSRVNYGENDNRYATAINNLAFLFEKEGLDKEAELNYLAAVAIRSNILQADHDDYIVSVQNLAFLYIRQAQFQKAEPVVYDWLDAVVKEGKEGTLAGARSWWLSGLLHSNMDNNILAEKELLRSLTIQDSLAIDSSLLFSTLKALVVIYSTATKVAEAEYVFKRFVSLSKIVDGESSDEYIYNVYQLAGLYGRANEFAKAEPYLSEVLAFYKNKKGTSSDEYITVAQNFSKLHAKLGWKKTADSIAKEIVIIQKEKYGTSSAQYADALTQAARIFLINGNNIQAEKNLEQSIAIVRLLNKPALLESQLYTLDSVLKLQNKTSQRFPLLNEMISLNQQYHFLSDSIYCFRMVELATAYINTGNYRQAVELLNDIDSTAKKGFRNDLELFVLSRRVIANIYTKMDLLAKASEYYNEALREAPKVWTEHEMNYIRLLADVGVFYEQAGQSERAEQFIRKTIVLLEKSKPTDPFMATLYNRLAATYDLKKDEGKKMEALKQAVIAAKKQQPYDSVNYIHHLNKLADYYAGKNFNEKAENLYKEIYNATRSSQDVLFEKGLVARIGIALINLKTGHTDSAANIIEEVLSAAKIFHKGTKGWSENLEVGLMQYYQLVGQYDKAEALAEKMSDNSKKNLGEDNPAYAFQLVVEANLYLQSGNFAKAEKTVASMNKIALQSMRDYFEGLTETEKNNYLQSKLFVTHTANTVIYKYPQVSASFIKDNYEVLLLLKSLTLAESRAITESVLQSKDTLLLSLYEKWLVNRRVITKERALPTAMQSPNLSAMIEMAEKQEKEIAKRSIIFRDQQKTKSVSIDDIRRKLADDEATIEFVNFAVFGERGDSGTYSMYAAYVLTKGRSVPIFVPLCKQKQLDRIFDSAGSSTSKMVEQFYRGLGLKNKTGAATLGKELYTLIWAPLEPYLKGIKKINYSPAGKLFSIAFHALPVDSASVLMDKYKLLQYTGTRAIASRSEEVDLTLPQSITLFGDARFTMDSLALVKQKRNALSAIYQPPNRGMNGSTWNDLPGTADEVKKVNELFKSKNIQTNSFTGNEASEENLKALSGHSPRVIHIATHGFFLPDPNKTDTVANTGVTENSNSIAGDPLLRSGLILAGGNYVWSGNIPLDGVEDGIATAYEISQLDLSNTELVVLSACETALGDVKGSEGVFGLQRAFKMAGVKKMIVSLWQVPDKETAELMTTFYSYWMQGKPINESFSQAQADMRKKYSPYYWAAFVLVE